MIQLHSPYLTGDSTWLKGNLHTHTTLSDGRRTPPEVIADYQRRGYDYLAITDHDTYAPVDEYQPLTQMILLPGVEVTANGPHILQLGIRSACEPLADRQGVLDAINARGGLAILNHPNWQSHYNHFSQEMMQSLRGAAGIEVYNGVIERLEGSALASDRWDRLLSSNRWLWGFANDDSHWTTDVGLAWNVVQAQSREPGAILDALHRGCFYASTGVVIDSVDLNGLQLGVRTQNAQRIRFISNWGVIRETVNDNQAVWCVPDDPDLARQITYVRVECYGAGGRMAWTQPIRIEVK
jgi:hypothetical protein